MLIPKIYKELTQFHVLRNLILKWAEGCLGGSEVEHLPSAQGVILESLDGVPHQTPCMEPASPSAYVFASISVTFMNK